MALQDVVPRLKGPRPRPRIVVALRHHLNLPRAGTGLVRFYDEVSPSGPSSAKPANLVPPPGPPMVRGAPLPLGPVDDDVSHRMRALGSSIARTWTSLRLRHFLPGSSLSPLPLNPFILPIGSLRKIWLTSVSDKKNAGAACSIEG